MQSFEHEELKLKSMNGQSVYAYEFYSLINPVKSEVEEETQSFSEIQRTAHATTNKKLPNGTSSDHDTLGKASSKGKSKAGKKSGEVRSGKKGKGGGGGGGGSTSICMSGIASCFKVRRHLLPVNHGSRAESISKVLFNVS